MFTDGYVAEWHKQNKVRGTLDDSLLLYIYIKNIFEVSCSDNIR